MLAYALGLFTIVLLLLCMFLILVCAFFYLFYARLRVDLRLLFGRVACGFGCGCGVVVGAVHVYCGSVSLYSFHSLTNATYAPLYAPSNDQYR